MTFWNRTLEIAALMLAITASAVWAEDAKPARPAATASVAPVPAKPTPEDNAALYCKNIANAAADARYARQADSLAAMNDELGKRIDALEKKRAEYEEWVKRREDFLRKADEAVVAIYSQMRPDAAAQQIAVMDAEAAAAILSKLSPRVASAILNEMDAPTAAHLTNVMAGLPADLRKDKT
jgi:flagellar motility protein MotE (MotC chaperone)